MCVLGHSTRGRRIQTAMKAAYCWLVYCWSVADAATTDDPTKLWRWPRMEEGYSDVIHDSFDYEHWRNVLLNRTTTTVPPPCMDSVSATSSLCEDMHPPGYSREQTTKPRYRINPFWFTWMDEDPIFPRDLHITVVGASANHSFRRFILQVRMNGIPVGKLKKSKDTVLVNCVPGVNNTLLYNGYRKTCFKFVNWIPPPWYNLTHPRWTPIIHVTLIKKPGIYWRMTQAVEPYRPTVNPYMRRSPTSEIDTFYDTKYDYLSMSRTYYEQLKREREEEEREKAAGKT